MPVYDYKCVHCRSRFDAMHAISAAAPPCPRCGGLAERQILSAPAVHGAMARGRDAAARSLPQCGKGCSCCP